MLTLSGNFCPRSVIKKNLIKSRTIFCFLHIKIPLEALKVADKEAQWNRGCETVSGPCQGSFHPPVPHIGRVNTLTPPRGLCASETCQLYRQVREGDFSINQDVYQYFAPNSLQRIPFLPTSTQSLTVSRFSKSTPQRGFSLRVVIAEVDYY